MTSGAKRALLVAAVLGLSMSMASCRDDEQGRPMVKQKGVYEGAADEALGDDHLLDLRSRTAGQKF